MNELQRAALPNVRHKLHIPEDEWLLPRTRQLLADRNLTGLYRLARRYGYSQTRIGEAVGKSQPQVSEIMNAATPHRAASIEVLHRHADAFQMPLHARLLLLGLNNKVMEEEAERIDRRDILKRRELLKAAAALAATGAVNWSQFSSRTIARMSDRDFLRWFAWELHFRLLDKVDPMDLPAELSEWAVAEASLPNIGFVRYHSSGTLELVDPALKDILVAQTLSSDILINDSARFTQIQTTHVTDKAIRQFVMSDPEYETRLKNWMASANDEVLRVNCAGVLAKLDSSDSCEIAVKQLARDFRTRELYMTAVATRVLHLDWTIAHQLTLATLNLRQNISTMLPQATAHAVIKSLCLELPNPRDAGARWCSVVMLSALRDYDLKSVNEAFDNALSVEPSREVLKLLARSLTTGNVTVGAEE